jgi:hypothetical protein
MQNFLGLVLNFFEKCFDTTTILVLTPSPPPHEPNNFYLKTLFLGLALQSSSVIWSLGTAKKVERKPDRPYAERLQRFRLDHTRKDFSDFDWTIRGKTSAISTGPYAERLQRFRLDHTRKDFTGIVVLFLVWYLGNHGFVMVLFLGLVFMILSWYFFLCTEIFSDENPNFPWPSNSFYCKKIVFRAFCDGKMSWYFIIFALVLS